MTDGFKWISFKDRLPEIGRHIYVCDGNRVNIEWHIIPTISHKTNQKWCYVYMPDIWAKEKLEPSDKLIGCSNNYILDLEKRIEDLEDLIRDHLDSD